MKIRLLTNVLDAGKTLRAGSVVELSSRATAHLLGVGAAEIVSEPSQKPAPAAESEPVAESPQPAPEPEAAEEPPPEPSPEVLVGKRRGGRR